MAGKPVGTIFVELDLDASRYTKGQQKLLKDAQSTTLNIEQNFKNLGIKSSAEMDLMRAKIKNSFDMIANSSKATANDIVRAEEAKNAKLQALNDQQYGKQKTMLESMKANWLAYSVAVYAAARAIGKAFEMAQAGAMVERQSQAFTNLAAASGTSSQRVIADLRRISGNMVSEADLMASAGKAMLMSIPAKDITELMKIAAATSRMTGQTITAAFADITMGVARQSRMILDNLGIIVNVDKANQDYASSLGKTADALSDVEKRQAFMTATLKAGADMIDRLGSQKGELDGVNKAVAAQADLWAEINRTLAIMVESRMPAYAKAIEWISSKLKDLQGSLKTSAKEDAWREIEILKEIENSNSIFLPRNPGLAWQKELEWLKKYGDASEAQIASEKAFAEWRKLGPSIEAHENQRIQNLGYGSLDPAVLKAVAEAEKKAKQEAEAAAKKSAEVNKTFWEAYKKEVDGAFEFERAKLDEQYKAFDKYVHDKVALQSWYQSEKRKLEIKEYAAGGVEDEERGFRSISEIMSGSEAYGAESARARAYKANQKAAEDYQKSVEAQLAANEAADKKMNEENWWKTYIEDTEDATRANEIFKDSMNIMSQSAADAFAEFATGTKSAKDAFTEMAQSMIASMVRMQTQKGFEAIFSMILSGSSGLLGSLFGGGSTPTGMGTNTYVGGNTGGTGTGWGGGYSAAKGAIFDSSGVQALARGGVVNGPTFFPMAKGTGLMGEAGPEAVMPLKRLSNGNLGVESTGKGQSSLTINVPVTTEAKNNKMASELRTEIEDTVERVVRRYS